MDVKEYALAIHKADGQGNREAYLDLWEQAAANLAGNYVERIERAIDDIKRYERRWLDVDTH